MWLEWRGEGMECECKILEIFYCESRGVSEHMIGVREREREGEMVINLVNVVTGSSICSS